MKNNIIDVIDSTFRQQVIKSELPVLVDCWALRCVPCKVLIPVLEELRQEYEGRLNIVKYNTTENFEFTYQYKIKGAPTLLIFNQGKMIAKKMGALSKNKLVDFLQEHLDLPL
ncbi:MAG: thioredoxin [Methylococcales bacterium]|nr:thioredoxin [Methylococcales bacterium]MBT7408359.1 thioredoxin [Methylococcales bacterium]